MDALQRLCMMPALRPDRMAYTVQGFVEENLGGKFVEHLSVEFAKSFQESGKYIHTNENRMILMHKCIFYDIYTSDNYIIYKTLA